MKKLLLLSLLINTAFAAYDPNAGSKEDMMQMQLDNGVVLSGPAANVPSGLTYGYNSTYGTKWCGTYATSTTTGVTNGSFYSDARGILWSTTTTPANSNLQSIAYNSVTEQYMAVGSVYSGGSITAGLILTSQDCSTWVTRTAPHTTLYRSIAVNDAGNMQVAVGASCNITYSANSTTWSTATVGGTACASSGFSKVIWAGNKFVAIGAGNIATSTNGSTWTNAADSNSLKGLAWNGSYYVGLASFPNRTLISTDLSTWTSYNQPTTVDSIKYINGFFVVTSLNSINTYGSAWFSKDGKTFRYTYVSNLLGAMAADDKGQIIAISNTTAIADQIVKFMRFRP